LPVSRQGRFVVASPEALTKWLGREVSLAESVWFRLGREIAYGRFLCGYRPHAHVLAYQDSSEFFGQHIGSIALDRDSDLSALRKYSAVSHGCIWMLKREF